MDDAPSFLRRREAGQYLKISMVFVRTAHSRKICHRGGGPSFRKVGEHPRSPVIYERKALDAWALGKMSGPCESTSDYTSAPSHKYSPAARAKPERPRHERETPGTQRHRDS